MIGGSGWMCSCFCLVEREGVDGGDDVDRGDHWDEVILQAFPGQLGPSC